MFEVGDTCVFTRSGGQSVVATVVGPSPNDNNARSITYTRDGKVVLHTSAPLARLRVVRSPEPPTLDESVSESKAESPPKPKGKPIQRQLFMNDFFHQSRAPVDASGDVVMQLTGDVEQPDKRPRSPDVADDAQIIDCAGPKKYRKRSKLERLAHPKTTHRDAATKLKYLDYADRVGDRQAAKDLKLSCAKLLRGWRDNRAHLEKQAKGKGSRKKTLHPGKRTRYHDTELSLREWIVRRRDKRVVVTKRMAIRYARRLDVRIANLESHQRMKWWSAFRRRRRMTTRRVTGLLKGGIEKELEKLCVRYRANIHAQFRSGRYKWLCNGDETAVSCEPKGTHTLAEVGERFVRIRVNGKWREHITVYLHYAIRIEKGVDAEGDPALVFQEARRLTPALYGKVSLKAVSTEKFVNYRNG